MRVLQLAARMLSLERFALPLMRRLRDEGFSVEAMGGFDGNEKKVQNAGFEVHEWEAGHTFNPFRILQARRQLSHFLQSTDYDIMHSHCSFGGILANAVAQHHVSHVIYTQHGFFVQEGLNPVSHAIWLQIEKTGLRPADHVICVSRAEQEFAQGLNVGSAKKFKHVPGAGVATADFALSPEDSDRRRRAIRDELGLTESDMVLLTVSRLTPDKGYSEMIEAASILRDEGHDLLFIAAGSGQYKRQIYEKIQEAQLSDRFRLLGWRDDVISLYAAADVFVFASHREGLPIASIEAMASGLPVVVSNIPGCLEEVEHGQSGLVFKKGDSEDLAQKLEKILTDAELRAKLSARAEKRASVFDIDNVLNKQLELYKRIDRCA